MKKMIYPLWQVLRCLTAAAVFWPLVSMARDPFYVVHDSTSNPEMSHQMQILNHGLGSFKKRLDMIRSAQSSLELEYFIFNHDQAGSIILQELVEAAKRGVQVRILVDKAIGVFELNGYFKKYLDDLSKELSGKVELRYYNDSSILPSTANFRNHRKLIVKDGQEAITGGRNIGDDYFDLSAHYNFLDRDVWVEGPVVRDMLATFDDIWNHEMTQKTILLSEPALLYTGSDPKRRSAYLSKYRSELLVYQNGMKPVLAAFEKSPHLEQVKQEIDRIGAEALARTDIHTCPITTFVSDRPGGNFETRLNEAGYFKNHRMVSKVIGEKLSQSKERVFIDSPYFINNKSSRELMNRLIDSGTKIDIFTNSLSSTDGVPVAANFYSQVSEWIDLGVAVHVLSSEWFDFGPVLSDEIKHARWGNHAKSIRYAEDHVGVGTYNIDNRSFFYNMEMVLFCQGSKELADDVFSSMMFRRQHAYRIVDKDRALTSDGEEVSIYGSGASGLDVMKMKLFTLPYSMIKFLF